jgi:hypothetical protein
MRNLRRLFLESIETLCGSFIKEQPIVAKKILARISTSRSVETSIIRNLVTRILPYDPLKESEKSDYAAFILAAPKDLAILPLTLQSVLDWKDAFLKCITIVGPESINNTIQVILTDIGSSTPIQFISDESLLSNLQMTREEFLDNHPLMLALKYLAAFYSKLKII